MKAFVLALALVVPAFAHAEERSSGKIGDETVAFSLGASMDTSRTLSSLMRLARRLEDAPGVTNVDVRLSKSDVLVRYDPNATGVPSLVTAVESLGYRARSKSEAELASAK